MKKDVRHEERQTTLSVTSKENRPATSLERGKSIEPPGKKKRSTGGLLRQPAGEKGDRPSGRKEG